MNIEIGERWVKTLRSGKYKQGKGFLERLRGTGGEFCCLGVLCNLAFEEGVVERREGERAAYYAGANAWLPEEVREWAGMSSLYGDIPSSCSPDSRPLSELNDDGTSFVEIAGIIEAHMEEL